MRIFSHPKAAPHLLVIPPRAGRRSGKAFLYRSALLRRLEFDLCRAGPCGLYRLTIESDERDMKADGCSQKNRLKSRSYRGRVAQLGEHLLCKQGVAGSIPATSTNISLPFNHLLIRPLPNFGKFGNTREQLIFKLIDRLSLGARTGVRVYLECGRHARVPELSLGHL